MGRKVMVNGKEVVVPEVVLTGQEIKELGDIPNDRNLILQRLEGNFLVTNRQKVEVIEGDYFCDAPTFEYGS